MSEDERYSDREDHLAEEEEEQEIFDDGLVLLLFLVCFSGSLVIRMLIAQCVAV